MSESPPAAPAELQPSTVSWRIVARGVEVRLRFLLAIGLLAGLMAGWPWLRGAWNRWAPFRSAAHAHPSVSGDTEYFCPMDPGIISTWPAICPICNMDLIQRKKHDAAILPAGVIARMQLAPYRIQLAGVRTIPARPQSVAVASEENAAGSNPSAGATAVSTSPAPATPVWIPASSVIHLGEAQVVYVESMPGMFDGVIVELGEHVRDEALVVRGLAPGQRVVVSGTYLLDAETRLNPGLATQYFGANASVAAASPPPTLPPRKARGAAADPFAALATADRELAQQQRICPVTRAPLGSMGTPTSVVVQSRKVFLCCRGCEAALLAEPEKYLSQLEAPSAPDVPHD